MSKRIEEGGGREEGGRKEFLDRRYRTIRTVVK